MNPLFLLGRNMSSLMESSSYNGRKWKMVNKNNAYSLKR
jgi:hypothetical protein